MDSSKKKYSYVDLEMNLMNYHSTEGFVQHELKEACLNDQKFQINSMGKEELADEIRQKIQKMEDAVTDMRQIRERKLPTTVVQMIRQKFADLREAVRLAEDEVLQELEKDGNRRIKLAESAIEELERQIQVADRVLTVNDRNAVAAALADSDLLLKRIPRMKNSLVSMPLIAFDQSVLENVKQYCCISCLSPKRTRCRNQEKVKFEKGKTYEVRLTCIINPGEFFVVLKKRVQDRNSIEREIHRMVLKKSHPPVPVEGGLYLVRSVGDEKWYRGRVLKLIPGPEKMALIFYIDYGNTENIPLSRLRRMPETMRMQDPFAVRCRLFECLPKGGEWMRDATEAMIEIVARAENEMLVMDVSPDYLTVDLSSSNVPSLRDYMLWMDYATFGIDLDGEVGTPYPPPILPQTGEAFEGMITHVISGNEVFIRKMDPDMLQDTLNSLYEKPFGLIHRAVLGMPCAARYSEDRTWHRAKITNFPGGDNIMVFYVDYGNQETLPAKFVRKIDDRFLKLAPQAIRFRLADVEPESYGKKYLESKLMEPIRVKVVSGGDSEVSKVVLFDDDGCINRKLNISETESDLSDSAEKQENVSLIPSELLNKVIIEEPRGENLFLVADKEFSEVENHSWRDTGEQSKTGAQLNVLINKSEDLNEKSEQDLDVDKTNDEEDSKIEIKIIKADSPSDLYVLAVSNTPKLVEQDFLQERYRDSISDPSEKWARNDKCAAFNGDKWLTGVVLEVIDDEQLKVSFPDSADVQVISVSNVRKLDPPELGYPLKCHLDGVFPPEKEWPRITCRFMKDALESCPHLFMTKIGKIRGDSWPIQVWMKKIIQGGALILAKEEWVSLNELIISEGLAVPEKAKLVVHKFPVLD